MMKILLVIPYFIPAYGYGGPLRICFETAKRLVGKGHDVTVATTDAYDDTRRIDTLQETIEGIQVVRFRNVSNRLAKHANGYLPIGFYSWLSKNLDTYDVVHCHDFFTYQNLVVSHACSRKKIPYIIQPHGVLSNVRQRSRFYWIKMLFTAIFKLSVIHAAKIIALTQQEKKEVLALGYVKEENIAIVPNGIDSAGFHRVPKVDLHEKYGIPEGRGIIGYIGRLQFIKGVDISLDILSKIRDSVPFTYLIIGPDEGEKARLVKKIASLGLEDRVIFTGLLEGEEKLSVIKSCNLVLFTSRGEGLPMSVLETAALGVPQVITTNCNVPEIGEAGAGFIFDLDETEAMANKIKELLEDRKALEALARNASDLARNAFDMNSVVQKLEEIMTSVGRGPIKNNETNTSSIPCPVCRSPKGRLLWEVTSHEAAQHFVLKEKDPERFSALASYIQKLWGRKTCSIVSCDSCGFCYSSPYIAGDRRFYELAYERHDAGYPRWKWEFELTFNALRRLSLPDWKLVEIGAGNGSFVKKLASTMLRPENILCTEFSEFGVRRIHESGIACLHSDLRDLSNPELKENFDAACLFQVLEHMDRPDEVFQRLNWLLKKGGHLFISVPNPALIEFNEQNGGILDMPPNHIGRWNHKCFQEVGTRNGFRVADVRLEQITFSSVANEFIVYRFLRKSQDPQTWENRIRRIRNGRSLMVMQLIAIAVNALSAIPSLLKMNSRMGGSQWVHMIKKEAKTGELRNPEKN